MRILMFRYSAGEQATIVWSGKDMFYLFALLFAISIVLLLFGLVNPRWVVFQRTKTRGRALIIYGTSALVSLFLSAISTPTVPNQSVSSGAHKQANTEQATPVAAVPTDTPTSPPLSPTPVAESKQSVSEPPPEVVPKASPKISTIPPEVPKPQPVEKPELQKATPKPAPKIVARSPEPDSVKPKPEPTKAELSDIPSRSPKKGNCECPYDVDSADRLCGKRSAFSKPKGEHPVCYK